MRQRQKWNGKWKVAMSPSVHTLKILPLRGIRGQKRKEVTGGGRSGKQVSKLKKAKDFEGYYYDEKKAKRGQRSRKGGEGK